MGTRDRAEESPKTSAVDSRAALSIASMSDPKIVPKDFGYVPQLDGLRAIAIALVVVGHVLLHTRYEQVAAIGVLIFFVMSGYLITSLLLQEERTGKVSIPDFFVRRAFRILPAMYVFIGVVFFLVRLNIVTDTGWVSFAASLLYVRNIFGRGSTLAHLWSLSLEEQFYFVWPLVFNVFNNKKSRLVICISIVVAVAIWRCTAIALHVFDYNIGIYYERTDFRIDSILAGCAIALAQKADSGRALGKCGGLSRVSPAFPLIILISLAILPSFDGLKPFLITLETAAAVCLVTGVALGEAPAFMRSSLVTWVGQLSYSIYLWQQLFIVANPFGNSVLVGLTLSVSSAICSHYFIERPFLKLKRRYALRRRQSKDLSAARLAV